MPETHSASAEPSADNSQPANGQTTNAPATDGEVEKQAADAGEAPGSSSWFEPTSAPAEAHTAEWFLRTGRAGLRPDSMESWGEDEDEDQEGHLPVRAVTAADPPWAGERTDAAGDSPPPWESGPWPGPGEDRPAAPEAGRAVPEAGTAPATVLVGNWQAAAALGTGILPLVIPGLVFGVLGLRRAAATGVGRTWSLIGIGLSVIWAVALIVYLASGGSSAPACGAAQTGVTSAVSQVLRDLSTGAPQSVLLQDLRTATNRANSAAVATSQLGVRNALVGLTGDLQQAEQDAASQGRVSYAGIRAEIASGTAAVTAACQA